MRVLLRQRETKQYYARNGEWVAKASQAAQFQTIEEAILFKRQAALERMDVVVVHSDGARKVVLPLGTESWAPPRWNVPGTAAHSTQRRI
jgi:hypothetical protein